VWTLVPLLIVLVLIVVMFRAQNRINDMSPRPTLVLPDDLGILPYPSIFPFALGLGLTVALTGPDEDQAPSEGSPVSQTEGHHRFVIVGAGYAGLHAGLRLATKLRDNPEVDLTLVDRHDYHQVLTELPRVAGGTRAADAVRIPLGEVLDERVRFTKTEVTGFDLADRRLRTDAGAIPYTRLVLALGSRPNDFDIPGLRDDRRRRGPPAAAQRG